MGRRCLQQQQVVSDKVWPTVMQAAPYKQGHGTYLFLVSKGWSQPWFLVDRIMWERMGKRNLLLEVSNHV